MSLFRKLKNKPALFLSTTGMTIERFEQLLPALQDAFEAQEAQRKQGVVKTGKPRRRKPGAGAPFKTDLAERLLMLLIYYRLYVTQEFMTLLFEVEHKSTICRAIKHMQPVFEAVLPVPERARKTVLRLARKETERRKRRIGSVEEFMEEYPELSILIDGTEQPKRRPKDPEKRKDDYSGKKKRHTLKQIITGAPVGLILDQSPSVGGRTHDFAAFKTHVGEGSAGASVFDALAHLRVEVITDSGFTGIDTLSLPCTTRLVERARRGHPLTAEQKVLNRVRSRERIKIEHTISRRKKYRIASEVYRNGDDRYDGIMEVVAGLVNLRVYDRIASETGLDLLVAGF